MKSKVKADLHVHAPKNATKQIIIDILKKAEKQKLKAIALTGYNFIDIYKTGGILHQIEQCEGLNSYFSGKIISSVEMVSSSLKIPSEKSGFYNNCRSDIMLYDFNPSEFEKSDYFNDSLLQQKWYLDAKNFVNKAKSVGIKMPHYKTFTYDGSPINFVHQFWKLLEKDVSYKKQVESILGRPLLSASDFLRNFVANSNGLLFTPQNFIPTVDETLRLAKKYNCKVSLNHPAHMNKDFDYIDYIISSVKYSNSNKDFQPIQYIEADYMLNSLEETKNTKKIAKKLGVNCLCGSDYQPRAQMYYIDPKTKKKTYYAPMPGFAIRKKIETGNGDLLIDESVLQEFKDVREYGIYNKAIKIYNTEKTI